MRLSKIVPLLVLISAAGAAAGLRAQESRAPVEVRRLAAWASARLRETSGIVVSRRHPGLLWTNNDSGDGPYLYLTDTTGALLARFEVRGARAVDWESLALGPCPTSVWPGRACLYIADTGDNDERRTRVVIYAVPEPDSLPAGARRGPTETARALRLRYADRPRDAEALTALPGGGLTLVTKGRTGPVLRFEIPPEAWDRDEWVLEQPDTLPINPQVMLGRWVTGAATAPDGLHVILRTYTELYRFRIGKRWELAGPVCRLGFFEPQGEGVDFLDAGTVILASERARGAAGGLSLARCAWE